MSTRNVTECDRCHREIVPAAARSNIPPRITGPVVAKMVSGGGLDLCASCTSKLESFMGGHELDEPP